MNYEIVGWDKVSKKIENACRDKKPFSMINLGDAEMIFLTVPEIATVKRLDIYLKISGVDKTMIKLKKDIIDLFSVNDYISVHPMRGKELDIKRFKNVEWAKFFYMWPELFEYYKSEGFAITEGTGIRYRMITDGLLFDLIKGAKVLLIGFYASVVEQRWKNPNFVEHYKKMNFDKIRVVGSVVCSEFKSGEEVDKILEKTKKFDYDVALVGTGISSCYLCPKIRQLGKIAIDAGHIIQAMAGKGEKHRPHINKFDYD